MMGTRFKIPAIKINIGNKLLIGIIAVITLNLLIASEGIISINELEKLSNQTLINSRANNTVQNLKSNFDKLIMPPNDYLIHGNQIELRNFKRILAEVNVKLKEYSELDSQYKEKIQPGKLEHYLAQVEMLALEIFSLKNPVGNEHGAELMENMDLIVENLTSEIEDIIDATEEDMRLNMIAIHHTQIKSTKIITITGLIIVLSLLIGGYFYVREITKPINQLEQTAQRISSGNSFAKVDVKTHDEIEKLANSFNMMIGFLEATTVSREYFNNILNRMTDSLIITDEIGNIKIVNKATLKLLEYTEKELIGQSIGMIISENKSKETCIKNDLIKKYTNKEHVNNVYSTYYTKNNRSIPVLFSRSLIFGKDDKLSGIIFIASNLIGKSRDEIQLEQIDNTNEPRSISAIGEIPLTKRELEIIKLITEGYPNFEIAEKLFISVRTVETHRKNIMQKLNTKSAISLVHYAYQNNII